MGPSVRRSVGPSVRRFVMRFFNEPITGEKGSQSHCPNGLVLVSYRTCLLKLVIARRCIKGVELPHRHLCNEMVFCLIFFLSPYRHSMAIKRMLSTFDARRRNRRQITMETEYRKPGLPRKKSWIKQKSNKVLFASFPRDGAAPVAESERWLRGRKGKKEGGGRSEAESM